MRKWRKSMIFPVREQNRGSMRERKKIGRFFALLLSAALMMESLPLTAFAAEPFAEEEADSLSGNTTKEPSAEEEADSLSDNTTVEPPMEETPAEEEQEPSAEEQQPPQEPEQVSENSPDTVSENALDTVSENTLNTVSENTIDSVSENSLDAEREAMIKEAQEAFAALLSEKPLMALLYHTDSYDVRSEADADSQAAETLEIGQTLYMQGVEITKQDVWYQAQYLIDGEQKSGYVQSYYLAYADEDWLAWEERYLLPILIAGEETEEAYESTAYGMQSYSMMTFNADASDVSAFPASYRSALGSLKNAHPNWTFVPMKTGLDFNTSVSKEMGDKSLIQKLSSNVEKGWVGDPCPSESGWNYATKSAVAYHMDPRNFLTEDYIFQFEQLTYNASYHTEAAVQTFLNGTFMKGKLADDAAGRTYARAFYEIGKGRKLSPIHLASRVYQEQGQGKSGLISGTYPNYEGYYNYFNVGVNGSTEAEKIVKGLTYAKSKGWNTRYKSLEGGAATIGNNYILKGQDTIYLEKFNVDKNSSYGVYNHQYMQNIQAPRSESSSTKKMYANAGSINSAFVFKIPVFENMPGETGGPEEPEEPEIPLESIALDQEEVSLLVGQSAALYVTYTPQDTTDDRTVSWKSAKPQVVTVADGRLTAVGTGEATVTATVTTKAGQFQAKCRVLVEGCRVTFMKRDGKTVLEDVVSVNYGDTLSAEVLQEKRKLLGTDPSGSGFIGWYTGQNGTGSRFDETSRIHEKQITLYPYYAEYGKGFYVLPVGDQTYTGASIKPKVQVFDGTVRPDGEVITAADKECLALIEGVDFTVSYKNNKKVNAPDKAIPTIIVKGKGNYTGTQEVTFDIVPKALTDTDITADDITAAYSGKVIKKAPTVKRNGKKLVKNTDYTVSYPQTGTGAYQAAGIYPVVIKGKGGYSGAVTIYEMITKKTLMSKVSVKKIPNQTYRNEAVNKEQGIGVMPESLQVTYKGQLLEEDKDYAVSYQNNMAIGTATATLTAVAGSDYTRSKSVTYKIVGTSIAGAKVEGIEPKIYTGTERDIRQRGYTLTLGEKTLSESTDDGKSGDYLVTYTGAAKSGAVKAGTATIVFQGINEYKGQLKKTYKIQPCSLEEAGSDIALSYHTQDAPETEIPMTGLQDITTPYVKGGSKPVIGITFRGQMLTQGKDYTVSYKRNNALTTADMEEDKLPLYTIKGKGNFKGKLSGTFTITDGGIDRSEKVGMTLKDVVYRQKRNAYKTKAVIKDVSGKTLAAGRDYDKNLQYTYAEDALVLTLEEGELAEQQRKAGEPVGETDIPQAGTVIRATATGMGAYAGEGDRAAVISGSYRIVAADIAKVKVRVAAKSYQDGRPVTLLPEDLTLTAGDGQTLEYGRDYTIVDESYVNYTKKGKAKVKIRGLGNYGGERTITYTIKAKTLWW